LNRSVAGLQGFQGFIGRLDSQKGYDLLLESLVEVLEDEPKHHHPEI
jgi:glycogen synthase